MVIGRTISTFIFSIFIFLSVPFTTWAKPGVHHEEPAYAPYASDAVSKEQQEKNIKRHLAQQARIKMLQKIAQNPRPLQNNTTTSVQSLSSPVAHQGQQENVLETKKEESSSGWLSLPTSALQMLKGAATTVAIGSYIINPAFTWTVQKIGCNVPKAYEPEFLQKVAVKTGVNQLPFLQKNTAEFIAGTAGLFAFTAVNTALYKAASVTGLTDLLQKFIFGKEHLAAQQKFSEDLHVYRQAKASGDHSVMRPTRPELSWTQISKMALVGVAYLYVQWNYIAPGVNSAVQSVFN